MRPRLAPLKTNLPGRAREGLFERKVGGVALFHGVGRELRAFLAVYEVTGFADCLPRAGLAEAGTQFSSFNQNI